MTDKMTDLQEAVAGVLTNYFDHPYDMLHKYVAVDILNELKYYDLIALVLERDKEIAELKTQISFERDINAGREDQLEQDIKHLRAEQRKRIADFKEEIEKKEETIADLKRDNKYFRKELGFWKGYVTGDRHDYEYDSLE